jgi:hypothetical protein
VTTVQNLRALSTNLTDVLRALDEVVQALTVMAPVTTRLREKLGHDDEDAAALEISVNRAMDAISRLQPTEADLITSALIG